jgi:hypothetical protein
MIWPNSNDIFIYSKPGLNYWQLEKCLKRQGSY